MIRTDLAIESLEVGKSTNFIGLSNEEVTVGDVVISTITIKDEDTAKKIGKPIGKYVTFNVGDFRSPAINILEQASIVSEKLKDFFPNNTKGALIVGLGNSDITPDALGPKTVSYCFATRHISGELKKTIGLENLASVCAIAPGVLGQTGIESAEVILSLVNSLKPSFVVVVDALAAKSISRLGNTIQVSNTGISPGSGVQNARKELNEKTLGVPVIAIGVPMVVDMSTIVEDLSSNRSQLKNSSGCENMMVTPREIDLCIEHASKMVAYSINKALQPSLSMDELVSLVG